MSGCVRVRSERSSDKRGRCRRTEDEDGQQAEGAPLHGVVVEQHVGQVRGEQRVHAARRARQAHGGVAHARAQRAGRHARQVHGRGARPAVHHLQRQAHRRLHGQVEAEVEPSETSLYCYFNSVRFGAVISVPWGRRGQ